MEKFDWPWYPIVFLPSNQKYKYEVTDQETISFDHPIIFWVLIYIDLAKEVNIR